MMPYKRILSTLLLFATFAFSQGIGPEQVDYNKVKVNPAEMQSELNTRADLLQALKTGNTTKVDSALLVLSYEKVPESAIDSLEILQVNLIRGRYDLAVPQFANMLMKERKKVRYSFANDSLYHYLRNESRFAAEYTDRPAERDLEERHLKLKGYMTEAAQANIKQEYKDLASIFVDLHPYFILYDKGYWIYLGSIFEDISPDSMANIISIRSEEHVDFHNDIDTLAATMMLIRMETFCENYPESEYSEWLKRVSRNIEDSLKRYKEFRAYYKDKFYTGGLGLELFIGNSSTFVVGVPIQISRFILTPSYINGESSITIKEDQAKVRNDFDEFFVTAGIDVYENKWLKIQPFAGGWDFFTAGLQADFRFWMSKTPGEFHGAEYMTLKFRYMGIYHDTKTATSDETEEVEWTEEKEWDLRFFVGIGVHFW
ncbi:hypothetical protein [Fibrobacter sp.]|uniref:hypothetical protein n=1 Tax=Fibrobacter sp. TaxID=35828 RepID=UPI0025C17332|nr:hypothetical protein [Fibrobacter sp.]MBR4008375.1 hypothetical protein [Fibrobacter sp.]